MAYRILKKVKDIGLNSTYSFVLDSNNKNIREFADKDELDTFIEEQLNLGIPKTSLEAVDYIEYKVSADINDDEANESSSTTDGDEIL